MLLNIKKKIKIHGINDTTQLVIQIYPAFHWHLFFSKVKLPFIADILVFIQINEDNILHSIYQ